MGLARRSLALRKDRAIEALQYTFNYWTGREVVDLSLRRAHFEDAVQSLGGLIFAVLRAHCGSDPHAALVQKFGADAGAVGYLFWVQGPEAADHADVAPGLLRIVAELRFRAHQVPTIRAAKWGTAFKHQATAAFNFTLGFCRAANR